jgi:hypothetical protein
MSARILERYSAAVNSGDLSVNPDTRWSDTDVLGATGLAGRYEPLGVALTRLFADGKPESVLALLTDLAFKRSRTLGVRFSRLEAIELSQAVLGWYRFGTCQPCGGTGYMVIQGTPIQGDECEHCRSTGKVDFDSRFPAAWLGLARWLSGEIDRAQAVAGTEAMRMLAPRLEL